MNIPQLSQDTIKQLRRHFFEEKQNFTIFKNVIAPEHLPLLQETWINKAAESTFEPFIANQNVQRNSPNYSNQKKGVFQGFYEFPWNQPFDLYTHSLCISLHQIRNQIEGQPHQARLFPFEQSALQYRVLHSISGNSHVTLHSDFTAQPPSNSLAKHNSDINRLQITVLLSTQDQDYSGEGFVFEENGQRSSPFNNACAGDVVFWRYNCPHAVRDISTSEGQIGFLRIILPIVDFRR